MDDVLQVSTLKSWGLTIRDWFFDDVLVWDTLIQLPIVAGALILAWLLARMARPWATARLDAGALPEVLTGPAHALVRLALPAFAIILLWCSVGIAAQLDWGQGLVRTVTSLVTAWLVIRYVSTIFGRGFWTRIIATGVWMLAALNIVDLLDPTIDFLDGISFTLGEWRVSLLAVIKGLAVLGLLLWLSGVLSRLLERRMAASSELTPSVQVLFSKLIKLVLVALAFVAALTSVGIDLSGLAIFSGALGIGIGLGLQRVVGNLVSGISLLLDKSIKPGDVIEVGGTYGWIDKLNARYASIVTRDGTEHLIPNEELITQRVINWSHSNDRIRLRVPIGIHYDSNVRKAMALCLEAATVPERVLADPAPSCFIVGFGDNSVDLELRAWISDPEHGIANVKGTLLLEIWDRFHEHGIEIPYPQRDLHIRSSEPIPVRMERPGPPAPGSSPDDGAP
jgi:small-conductance mechanosensitive channel